MNFFFFQQHQHFFEYLFRIGSPISNFRCTESQEMCFFKKSAGSTFFHALYLPEPVGTSPRWLIHLPSHFTVYHFLRKQSSGIQKLAGLIAHSTSIRVFRAAYPNSKIPVKSISKNGNSDGSIGSKSKLARLRSGKPLFFLST